ncbi:MAG: hypothetical protein KAG61_09320 [Bacteriovoracaceae bacterium]|nr:hypothetical protein [Bacteriovoracaceae bacterium]
MRNNLGLLTVLIALIATAYFTEELGEQNKRDQLKIKERLYDPETFGELQGLQTPAGKILRGRNDYYTAKEYKLVDRSLIEFVFDILGGIKAKRFLTPDDIAGKERSSFIPDESLKFTFLFEKGTLTYVMGSKLEFDRSFYMEIHNSLTGEKTMVVAYDITADETPHLKEIFHRSSEKFNRLLALLALPENYFYDRHILKKFTMEKVMADWTKVSISNIRNRSFSIKISDFSTNPGIVPGLEYNRHSFKVFLQKLIEIKAKNIILKWDREKLSGPLASIKITKKSGKKIAFELFNSYQGEEGYYITSSDSDDLYRLDRDAVKPFFGGHQVFWKKIALSSEILNAPRFPFKLTVGKESFNMMGYFRGKRKVQILDNQKLDPKQKVFRKIFDQLSDSADVATVLNQSADENKLIKDAFLSIEVGDDLLYFTELGSDLLIINGSKSYIVRFQGAAGQLPHNAAGLFYAKE